MTSVDEIILAPVEEPSRGELLLELLSEEIPARMQRRAIEDLTRLLRDKLVAAEIPAANLRGYVTPRRLAVIAEGIPSTQPDRTEERRGPRVSAPVQAIDGFLRSTGLSSVEACEIRDTGRGEFYFAVIKRSGRPAAAVLPDLIKTAIAELPWPKSMRWPGSPLRWVRPLTSVLCLYDGEVLPLSLDSLPPAGTGGVPVGRTTRGHRFLSPGEICVGSAEEYVERLQNARVVLDQDRRKELIREGLENVSWPVKPDPDLLYEVTGLVEFPVVLAGAIDSEFMALPHEVLTTVMRTHQKYFFCHYPDGTPAPRFMFVVNNVAADGGKVIIAGNERVLRARLADARFFWDQDSKVPLEERIEGLKDRVFHAKLGSMYDKVERMAALAGFLAPLVDGADEERAKRAAWLAKADLSTAMVGEFPELQGIMGKYYYEREHDSDQNPIEIIEHTQIATAIGDHYRPLGPNDFCPRSPDSIVVALADKIDTLVGFFALGEKPTGSRDPFALRRAGLGMIRLVLENRLRLPLINTFREARSIWAEGERNSLILTGQRFYQFPGPFISDPTPELMEFIADRLIAHLREEGVRHDVIAAAFFQGGIAEDDLVRLVVRITALRPFLDSEDGANLLIAFRRASNIVAIEERRDGRRYDAEVVPAALREPEERALFDRLAEVDNRVQTELVSEEFEAAMAELARLRQPVDAFFEKVTVNTDDAKLRENRLRLLARIRATMNQVADFSLIEG